MLKKRERTTSEDSTSEINQKVSKNTDKVEKINTKKQKIVDSPEEDEFTTLGISKHLVDSLAKKSILSLFEVQKKVFKPVYEGKNTICASLTGSGKTLAFALPIVQKNMDKSRFTHTSPVTLVIAPTRELSIQIAREFTDLSSAEFNYKVVLVYGGVSIDDQCQKLRRGCDIVVGTPGRIIDMIERGVFDLANIRSVVLDEADKMLSMGFQEPIEEIFGKIYALRAKIQVCLFSATIERGVKQIASKIMKGNESIFIDLVKDLEGKTPKTVQHLAVNTLKSDRVTTIADLILCYGGKNKATIVFVNTKRECNDLMISDKIKQEVQIVHGDINQKQREATIEGFKKGKFKCLVATDVASRGLDIPMVDLVIQSEPPKEVDSYIHRAGRTARAGRSGVCITLYSRLTEGLITRIEQKAKFKFTKIGAPQKSEIMESSVRDITTGMDKVDESMVKFFQNSAQKVIDEYGAEAAIARLIAYVSGNSDKLKARSLLVGAEGFITYSIKFNSAFNHAGYVWGFLKRMVPEDIKGKIRGMRPFKTMDGCVFDFPEDTHKDFEEIIFGDRMYGKNYTMEKTETLPELQEDESNKRGSFGGSNSWGNGNNNYGSNNNRFSSGSSNGGGYGGSSNGGGSSWGNKNGSSSKSNSHVGDPNSSKPGKIDFFLGNLPYKIEESDFIQWASGQGVKDIEVRFVIDKEQNAHKGFGFISIYDQGKKDNVLSLNGKNFNGKALRINEAKSK